MSHPNATTKGVFVPSWRHVICVFAMVAGGCSPPTSEPKPIEAALRPVVLPDLSRMDKGVQDQMREAHATLTKTIENGASTPAERGAAYGAFGNLLMAAEYLDAAEPCYLNAQALMPGEVRWPYYLGHLYRTRGEPANAARAFGRALEIAPNDVASLVWLGRVTLDQGKPEAADELFGKAAALQPRGIAVLAGEGRAALARRDYARAVERLELALSIDPRASTLHYPLALAYRGLGEAQKAEAETHRRGDVEVGPPDPLMQELAGVLNSATAFEKRGLRALEGGDWPAAAAALRKAVELAPESATLHHRFGTALSLSGNTRGAVEQFEEAIRLTPGYAPAYFSLGVLYATAGRFAEAAERFSAAVRYEPSNPDARLQFAVALIKLQRYKDAHDQLVEGQRRHPDRPEFARMLQQFRPAR